MIFVAIQLLLLFGGERVSCRNNNDPSGLEQRSEVNGLLLPCPKECICSLPSAEEQLQSGSYQNLPTVTCSKKNLTSIPDGILPSVRKL
jgi:hypothetical protein